MDVGKQIDYWRKSGDEDFAAAEALFEKNHFRHSLFFVHLAIEKVLKAHVSRQTNDIPPRIHNLIRLAEIAGLKLNDKQQRFLRTLGLYQLEGRYPDSTQVALDLQAVREKFNLAKEIIEWLKAQL